MTDSSTERQDHLDCAHGLMILHMMFTHLCASTIADSPYFIPLIHPLSFFMAWFFYKSGMFYKDRTIVEVIKYGLYRMILPALVFSIIGFFYFSLSNHPDAVLTNVLKYFYLYGSFPGNFPLWFLFSLFIVTLFFSVMRKCHFHPIIIVFISLSLFYLNKHIGFRPFMAYNVPLGMMFYALGYALRKIQYDTRTIILSAITYVVLLFIPFKIDFLYYTFKPAIVAIPWALAGCILTNATFKVFPKLCISPFRFIGRYAMEFYCTHIIVIFFCEDLIKHFSIHSFHILFEFAIFAIYLISLSLILHFFKLRKIQWMFGRSVPQ